MTIPINKILQIDSIATFDRSEIDYLLECCNHNDLMVRYHAYLTLARADRERQILSMCDRSLISKGILLAPEDIVWSVYQSGISHDDDRYSIEDFPNETGNNIYGQRGY
jgi:hypothetical protein